MEVLVVARLGLELGAGNPPHRPLTRASASLGCMVDSTAAAVYKILLPDGVPQVESIIMALELNVVVNLSSRGVVGHIARKVRKVLNVKRLRNGKPRLRGGGLVAELASNWRVPWKRRKLNHRGLSQDVKHGGAAQNV
eukprot:6458023-Amphidinium_carterae.3